MPKEFQEFQLTKPPGASWGIRIGGGVDRGRVLVCEKVRKTKGVVSICRHLLNNIWKSLIKSKYVVTSCCKVNQPCDHFAALASFCITLFAAELLYTLKIRTWCCFHRSYSTRLPTMLGWRIATSLWRSMAPKYSTWAMTSARTSLESRATICT